MLSLRKWVWVDPSHSEEASLANRHTVKRQITVKDYETTYHPGNNTYDNNVKILCRGKQLDPAQTYGSEILY